RIANERLFDLRLRGARPSTPLADGDEPRAGAAMREHFLARQCIVIDDVGLGETTRALERQKSACSGPGTAEADAADGDAARRPFGLRATLQRPLRARRRIRRRRRRAAQGFFEEREVGRGLVLVAGLLRHRGEGLEERAAEAPARGGASYVAGRRVFPC